MKVLQINSVCGVGSTGRIAIDLYKVLEEQGHECVIAYGRGTAPKGIKTIKIGSNLDNYLHVAKTRIFDKHGFGSTKATKEFIEKVKEYDPDIIHLHNIHGYYINIEVLFNYLKEANKTVIWTLHDCWAFTGHCSYFDFVGCEKWKNKCKECKEKKAYPSSFILDNSSWNYEKKRKIFTSIKDMTIVTPSKWLSQLVKKSFLSKYDVEVINNGIDLNVFKPLESNFRKKFNIEDKIMLLGVASVWEKRKGLKYFIELDKRLNNSYQIVLVGVGEKEKEDLPNSIISINRTNSAQELAKIYTSADLFINPTLEDNFPTTNLEALACGTPVITFNTGGSIECIDLMCGKVVQDNKIETLIKSINELGVYFKSINSKSCIKKAKHFYNKEKKYAKYIDLYEVTKNESIIFN